MADPARARRLAKRIVTIVATELEHEVKDPRLAMVTITAARVTPDLHDATVYYTVYGDQIDADSSAAALASATGVLRSAVGRQTGVKFTPTLQFRPDTVPEQSKYIEDLLVSVRESDAELAQRATGASYAGDADPYRKPREVTDDTDGDDFDDAAGDDGGGGGGGDAAGDDAVGNAALDVELPAERDES